jgi:6-pyruvoyltetrahydropterin/6-carboxytetrahydropterin synthase
MSTANNNNQLKRSVTLKRIRLTKAFNFEMAHALHGHDGPCKHIHGHSYELFVTIIGTPIDDKSSPKFGMLMDFKDLKQLVRGCIIDDFDHALVLHRPYAPQNIKEANDLYGKLILVDYQPTSENLLIDFAERIRMRLPDNVGLHSLKLRETLTSYAEWFASDNA